MKMLLVTQSKGRVNQLGYDKTNGEYVYIHQGQEIWREKGDTSLLDYFIKEEIDYFETIDKFPIFKRYSKSCESFIK